MKESNHIKILISIAVIAGAMGGIGNYLMMDMGVDDRTSIVKPIFLGIIAAAVLPLFLKLVSSNILDFVDEHLRFKNYTYFVSLCLLAALFGDVFLQGIYAKVFNELTEEIATIDKKVESSNEKADYALYNIKLENDKKKDLGSAKEIRDHRDQKISDYAKDFKLNKAEAAILFEIKENKISEPDELYKLGDKAAVDKALSKFKKEDLVKELDLNNTKVIVPQTKFMTNLSTMKKSASN
ncbi:YEATS-associated helix-containing protein [Algibacter sp. AS12]|uniref:YEATS-associated helix-containing protein n=1 Tax=Algibacter sp. AS12 TaxID=3135773 RepID=UPI00398ACF3A